VVAHAVFRTPDDGYKEHPKHVQKSCSEIKYRLLSVASRWKLIYIIFEKLLTRGPELDFDKHLQMGGNSAIHYIDRDYNWINISGAQKLYFDKHKPVLPVQELDFNKHSMQAGINSR
jgi:hypothetical protein